MTLFWSLFFVVGVIAWAAAETYAVRTGRQTLSAYVWSISVQFPLLPFIIGLFVGGLAAHFWWYGEASCFPTGATP
jgi:hypothetical protein